MLVYDQELVSEAHHNKTQGGDKDNDGDALLTTHDTRGGTSFPPDQVPGDVRRPSSCGWGDGADERGAVVGGGGDGAIKAPVSGCCPCRG